MDRATAATFSHHEIADIDRYAEVDPHSSGLAAQLDPGHLRLEVSTLAVPGVIVQRLATSRALALEGEIPTGWTGFAFCPGAVEGGATWCGLPVRGHAMAVFGPAREQLFKLPAGWSDVMITVSSDLLDDEDMAPRWLSEGRVAPDRGQLRLPSASTRAARGRLFALLSDGPLLESACADPESAEALRHFVLRELRQALRQALDGETRSGSDSRRYELVRRSLARLGELRERGQWLNVDALCQQVGANRRALERAFAEVLHTSPYQFLLRVRLGLCRSALLRSGGAVTVQQIALDHGFCSASEFSLHYRRFFGERPSATLRGEAG